MTTDIVANVALDIEYYPPKSAYVLVDGNPAVIIQPVSGGRTITYLNKQTGIWSPLEQTPWAASEIVVDKNGNQWMFASGLQVFKRSTVGENWVQVGQIGTNLAYPKSSIHPHGKSVCCSCQNQ